MDNIVYIEGVGYCKEVTVNRYNEDGVNEPYNIYEPVQDNFNKIIASRFLNLRIFSYISTVINNKALWRISYSINAEVVELVDTRDLKSLGQ